VTLVHPKLVVEVGVDVARDASGRWRHPARLHRARPDLSSADVPLQSTPPGLEQSCQSDRILREGDRSWSPRTGNDDDDSRATGDRPRPLRPHLLRRFGRTMRKVPAQDPQVWPRRLPAVPVVHGTGHGQVGARRAVRHHTRLATWRRPGPRCKERPLLDQSRIWDNPGRGRGEVPLRTDVTPREPLQDPFIHDPPGRIR
jgi:hypothetical protein